MNDERYIDVDLSDIKGSMRVEGEIRRMMREGWEIVYSKPVKKLRETVLVQRIYLAKEEDSQEEKVCG